jgi:PBP1b-binding outer membrane lipoprotein LpoB
MKNHTPLIALTLLALAFAGCSKHSPDTTSTSQKDSVIQTGTYHDRLANLIKRGATGTPQTHDTDTILPERHMSERQVADIAFRELPRSSNFSFQFKDGLWEILEPQKGVWGVSSAITNSDGKIVITSTNATRVVLRVQDADGKVEPVKTP